MHDYNIVTLPRINDFTKSKFFYRYLCINIPIILVHNNTYQIFGDFGNIRVPILNFSL